MTDHFKVNIPGEQLTKAINTLVRRHGGVPNDEKSRAMLISAFAQDVGLQAGDTNAMPTLGALAYAAFHSWEANGIDYSKLVHELARMKHPGAEFLNINLQVAPLTKAEADLMQMPAAGKA